MDYILKDLNPFQRKAVTYGDGPLLILAGAGSGKTRALTHRAAYLVSSKEAHSNELLLLTFTNKAAEEMKKRLLKLLASSKLETRGLFAGTFHSFCAYVLRRDGPSIGIARTFVIYDQSDQLSLIKKIIKRLGLSEGRLKPGSVASVIESAKNNLINAETFMESTKNSWQESLGLIYQEYQKELKKSNALDFNDLLFFVVELFKKEPRILEKYQKQYRHILIDEYQDTNRSQYILTKLLAQKSKSLTVVGDAAQAIYGWRGADYRNLMNLSKDFPKIKVINLEQNYRSTQTILDVAYSVISKNEKHPILKLFTQNDKGKKVMVYRSNSELNEAGFIAEKIKQLTDFEGIDPTKIAVLYRTNAQSRVVEETFIRYSLPYILIGGVKFYDRAEVKDVLSLIRVFYNPKDSVSWERIKKNFGVRREKKVKEFIEKNKKYSWESEKLLESILEASGCLEKYDPDDEEDNRRLENIKELASVAARFSDIGDFLENVALVQQEYSAQEKEKGKISSTAIRLMTLHSSKGLEFDVVFIIGLEEGLLPHSRSLEDKDGLEEERRLCYVGMTRAKKYLFLTCAAKRLYFGQTNYNSISRFIEDIPKKLVIKEEDEFDLDGNWDDDDWNDNW